jgi:hypothetical protein
MGIMMSLKTNCVNLRHSDSNYLGDCSANQSSLSFGASYPLSVEIRSCLCVCLAVTNTVIELTVRANFLSVCNI